MRTEPSKTREPTWATTPPSSDESTCRSTITLAFTAPASRSAMAFAVASSIGAALVTFARMRPSWPSESSRKVWTIADELSRKHGAQILLDRAVDPAILGGVVARVGSLVYDGSVRTQLEDLRKQLKQ